MQILYSTFQAVGPLLRSALRVPRRVRTASVPVGISGVNMHWFYEQDLQFHSVGPLLRSALRVPRRIRTAVGANKDIWGEHALVLRARLTVVAPKD